MADLLWKDLRFAIRQLRRNPGFTVTAIIVLTLGVCASLAIFAFVDAALIKPLPYRDPARLVGVFERIAAMPRSNLSYPDYLDWKRLNTVFTSMDMYNRNGFQLNTKEGAEPVRGARVSSGFFRTLGVAPVAGRDFHDGEDMPGAPRVAMISYGAWQARYGGRADVVGTVVTLDGEPTTIVGVLPRDFHFAPAEPAEFWPAFHAVTGCDIRRGCHGLYGVARLKDGVSMETALSNVTSIAQALEKQYPDSNRGQGASLATLTDVIVGNIRPVLLVLLSGAGLLLLIASVNVAGLLLVRSESRQREIAVRTALGASSGRLLRQFVTEAVVLGGAASALGMLSSHWVIHLLRGLISERMRSRMPFLRELGWNPSFDRTGARNLPGRNAVALPAAEPADPDVAYWRWIGAIGARIDRRRLAKARIEAGGARTGDGDGTAGGRGAAGQEPLPPPPCGSRNRAGASDQHHGRCPGVALQR
jgi:predicted permease